MITLIKNNWIPSVVLFYSVSSLIISAWAEFGFRIPACQLCYFQRLVLLILVPLSFFSITKGSSALTNFFLSTALLALLCISSYHFLIQLGLFNDSCLLSKAPSRDAFLASIKTHNGCSAITFKILGIPASFVNTLFSLCCLLFQLFEWIVKKKNKLLIMK
ncbi:disulfide bond formation protein B [Chlamydiales bacterium]|nr:disulfide bond formation protein B [Chlamydiales bacterium]